MLKILKVNKKIYIGKFEIQKFEKKKKGLEKGNNSPSREEDSGSRSWQGRHVSWVRWITGSDREGGGK
jgi:hypothetical protein